MSQIDKTLEKWFSTRVGELGMPGAAAALVVGSETALYAAGEECVGKGVAITPETLFSIASCSKSFTAMGLASLVEQGKLDFDDLATEYLPELTLDSEELTAKVTLRDLVGMRLGLQPLGAAMWGRSRNVPHGEMLRRMQYLPRTAPFREGFIYSNISYTAIAETIARVSDQPFKDYIKTHVFDRVGLGSSFIEEGLMPPRAGVAVPHVRIKDELVALDGNRCGGREGESCQYSNATDMARWLRFHLNGGKVGGKQSLSTDVFKELHAIQMRTPAPDTPDVNGYCMGWMRGVTDGTTLLTHEGGELGASAFMILSPEKQIGIAVLINMRSGPDVRTLAYELLDRLSGDELVDRHQEFQDMEKAERAALMEVANRNFAIEKGPMPDLANCEGRYRSPHSGELTITQSGKLLRLDFADMDTFNSEWVPLGGDIFRMERCDDVAIYGEILTGLRLRIDQSTGGAKFAESAGLGRFDRVAD